MGLEIGHRIIRKPKTIADKIKGSLGIGPPPNINEIREAKVCQTIILTKGDSIAELPLNATLVVGAGLIVAAYSLLT
ncbi:MAG: hypothetical protein NUV58_01605 [Candidatus Roizmanbacteria bacterium]|nr:hypothetical protein [Candidatus Roizmanbacteria bacterium]